MKEYFDIDEFKPRKWLMIILIILLLVIVVILLNKVITDKKEKEKDSISNRIKNTIKDATLNTEFEKTSFNAKYEACAGSKWGTNVSSCLDDVILNNKKNTDHIISVVYKDKNVTVPDEIKDLKKNWSTFTDLEVSVDYDSEGYVNKITIEDVTKEEKKKEETTAGSGTVNNKNTTTSNSEYENAKKEIDEKRKEIEEKQKEFEKEFEENSKKIDAAKKAILGD